MRLTKHSKRPYQKKGTIPSWEGDSGRQNGRVSSWSKESAKRALLLPQGSDLSPGVKLDQKKRFLGPKGGQVVTWAPG